MSNLTIPAREWLAQQFETEYCAECGGDACHHTAVPFNDNWFARCNHPPTVDGMAPTIQKWHHQHGDSSVIRPFNRDYRPHQSAESALFNQTKED